MLNNRATVCVALLGDENMKKGCIIVLVVLAVLFLLLAIAGVVAFNVMDKNLGIRLAPEISHEVLALNDSRIRMVIKPELLSPYLIEFIPKDVEIDTHGFEMQRILNELLPREIAILAHADMGAQSMHLTLFANEKRGGPFITELINAKNPFERVAQVIWTSMGFELRERGMVIAEGNLPIPGAVEAELLKIWPTRSQQPPATIQGNNQIELVIDNMNGDILAFTAAGVVAAGKSWEALRQEQMANMAIGIIESIGVVRGAANMIDNDTAEIDLNITADADSGAGLQFLISSVGLPGLKDLLKKDYGLILTGDSNWDEAKGAVVGKYTVTGLEEFIRQQIGE